MIEEQGLDALPVSGNAPCRPSTIVPLDAPSLFDVYAVHCFLAACPHVVRAATPKAAHDEMERHYDERHGPLIARLAAQVRVTS